MFEGAVFADAGNIWSTKDSGIGDEFKFNKFISQMGLGSGFGLRMHVAYITVRIDLAYKLHDPNQPKGERWVFDKIKPFKPLLYGSKKTEKLSAFARLSLIESSFNIFFGSLSYRMAPI